MIRTEGEKFMLVQRIATLAAAAAMIAAGTLLPAGPGHAADKAKMFNLGSPTIKEFGMLAKKNAGMNSQNKNCIGENVSPALRWSGAPPNTKSYMIMLFDPAGRVPLGVVHWLAYGIPAAKTSLKEGEATKPSTEFKGGKNIAGGMTYTGPCPAAGDKPHPYTFILAATDLDPGGLAEGMNQTDLAAALQGHILGSTTFVTRFGH
jgi:hypothetical protein